ncbi:flagellar basal-body rod protein FlgG [Iodidimonas muriae]|uniref:Flagellar basal-body rod protein FlgG n=1 Tax=Iodidimonas muriae TaxID=261467 RepID=A0ABQ2LFN0_9PROT|nr:flagellar basal-body rod protein FlgG [Iodidimonas muriae]GER08582.1 flagellar basal-body rod protein FlgG [Kordiimonadales bacterium JCM 17843]GGO15552.1 flagellar basal-body rod protein FlgG [Iodidimonas muriae]
MRALKIAATGMMAQQMNVEVIANNISNVNTTAFKRNRAEFSDLMYQTENRQGAFSSDAGTIIPAGVQLGLGVKASAVSRIGAQGALIQTSNPLDVAIEGRGFFAVTLPDGDTAYSRAGNFQLSEEGQIVTNEGFQIDPGIFIPQEATDIIINEVGEVFAQLDGQTDPVSQGQITLVTFLNEVGLEALGDNLFRETAASGDPQLGIPGEEGFGTIRQRFVEGSNVNIVEEITNLITVQRAYEMNSKVIETADEMSRTVTNLR